MQKITQSLSHYIGIVVIIAIWWSAAFSRTTKNTVMPLPPPTVKVKQSFPQIFPYLSNMNRNLIHRALSGDVALMAKLMVEWDVDAEILENHGICHAKRLQRELYLKGQLLGRSFLSSRGYDERRFLPQTYTSASILMALVAPANIVGIPKGIRDLPELYPASLTNRIPQNIDFYSPESLHRANPSLAIVSSVYTHPSVIQTLHSLGIPVVAQCEIDHFDDIKKGIAEIGHAVGQNEKAEMLTIFMEAAMLAIDNRMHALSHMAKTHDALYSTLYLTDHSCYSAPSKNSLIGQLLARMGNIFPMIQPEEETSYITRFSTDIDNEMLIAMKPGCLIISSLHPESSWEKIERTPLFEMLQARKNGKIFFVNENVQLTSDQYIVLAYYDLAIGLINAHIM